MNCEEREAAAGPSTVDLKDTACANTNGIDQVKLFRKALLHDNNDTATARIVTERAPPDMSAPQMTQELVKFTLVTMRFNDGDDAVLVTAV